jgi:hypothetical protein
VCATPRVSVFGENSKKDISHFTLKKNFAQKLKSVKRKHRWFCDRKKRYKVNSPFSMFVDSKV